MREPDEVITQRFLADLHGLYPQTRGVIAGATVQRWELGNVYARPGRAPPAAAARGRARRPPQPPPRRRLLRRAGEHGGRRPDRRGRRRARRGTPARPTNHRPTRGPTMPDFHGVLPALITPFTDDGAAVDGDALAAIVERLIGAGVGGLVPGGSTGEFTTLSDAERRELVEVDRGGRRRPRPRRRRDRRALHARDGRAERPRRARRRRRGDGRAAVLRRARAGASCSPTTPPWPSAISIPIMYYNLPSASGVTLDAEQLARAAAAARA